MKRIPVILLMVSLLFMGSNIAAQDTAKDNPLLQLLALVPDTPETREGTPLASYVDYRAVEAARGIATPTVLDFDAKTDLSGLWLAALNGVVSGPELSFFMVQIKDMEALVGFNWFDVNRAIAFGNPPRQGKIFTGKFDSQRITAAFKALNYTAQERQGVTLLCGSEGCEDGLKQNLKDRNPVNPFGGQLGRKEPLALLPGHLVNSPSDIVVENILAAHQKSQKSLAENPAVQASVHAIGQTGAIRQVQFWKLADLDSFDTQVGRTRLPPEVLNSVGNLPAYSLAFLADTWQGGDQLALVGAVYDDPEIAKAAASELTKRAENYFSVRVRQPFANILKTMQGRIEPAYVVKHAPSQKAVVVLTIRYPMPSNEKQDVGGREMFVASGLVFRFIVGELYTRAFYLLATSIQ